MNMAERRRFPRYRYQGTGRLTDGDQRTTAEVSVASLSIGGCRVLGANLPLRGARCQLSLQGKGKEFKADCEIAWHGEGVAGIKFIALDERSMELLREICKDLRLEPLQPPSPPEVPRPE